MSEPMGQTWASDIEMCLFGSPDGRNGRKRLGFRDRRTWELIALLVLEPPQTRESLGEQLWPSTVTDAATRNVGPHLTSLREGFGDERVLAGRGEPVRLLLDDAYLDVREFESHIRRGDPESLEAAVAAYTGPLLQGYKLSGRLFDHRERLRDDYASAREDLARMAMERGETRVAIEHLELALAEKPTDGACTRQVMELLAVEGRLQDAINTYERLRRALLRNADETPAEELVALARELRRRLSRLRRSRGLQETPRDSRESRPGWGAIRYSDQPLIGRSDELVRIRAELTLWRVRTLVGPPGVGKTSVAREVAARWSTIPGSGGALYFELGEIYDSATIIPRIAQALQPDHGSDDYLGVIAEFFGDREGLLVLDDCDTHRAVCAKLAEFLIGACKRLCILATSQSVLPGLEYSRRPLAPLGYVPDRTPATPTSLQRFPSSRLLLSRLHAIDPSWEMAERDAAEIAQLCRLLDGLPLALVLAAPLIRVYGPEGLNRRLATRIDELNSLHSVTPLRHRGLRAALELSYLQLPPRLKRLLRRLSVFEGGCDGDAAEAVLSDSEADEDDEEDDAVSPGLVLPRMQQIEEHSLLEVRRGFAGQPRFYLLRVVRQFARTLLEADQDDTVRVRRRHTQHFSVLAQTALVEYHSFSEDAWLGRLDWELDNLHGALRAQQGVGRASMVCALEWFWYTRGHYQEGLRWYRRAAIDLRGTSSPDAQRLLAKVKLAEANLAYWQTGEWTPGLRRRSAEALAAGERLDDQQLMADVLATVGAILIFEADSTTPDYEPARRYLVRALRLARRANDAYLECFAGWNLAWVRKLMGNRSAARAYYRQALALAEGRGDRASAIQASNGLGELEQDAGALSAARRFFEQARELNRELGDRSGLAESLGYLGTLAIDEAIAAPHLLTTKLDEADRSFRDAQRLWFELGERTVHVTGLPISFANLLAASGDLIRAAALRYAVKMNDGPQPAWQPEDEKVKARLHGRLDSQMDAEACSLAERFRPRPFAEQLLEAPDLPVPEAFDRALRPS